MLPFDFGAEKVKSISNQRRVRDASLNFNASITTDDRAGKLFFFSSLFLSHWFSDCDIIRSLGENC